MTCHLHHRLALGLFAACLGVATLLAADSPLDPGYLTKGPAYALRFAAPAKVPIAPLPALPISYDPQPQFAPAPAQPIVEAPAQTTIIVTTGPTTTPNTLSGNDLVRQLLSQQPLTVGAGTGGIVKFFQSGTNQIGITVDPTPLFQPPATLSRPSSATYQQK